MTVYRDQPSWQKLMRNGMAKDFPGALSARIHKDLRASTTTARASDIGLARTRGFWVKQAF